ncbi:hypothetical protein KKH23_10890 [Patescibacteria group bacterium]|nr:hypothetical protein [Patescibacteria group bacterium]
MALSTQLNKASPFSFELVFPLIPVQTELKPNEEFTLNIFETVIPGVTLDMSEHNWMGGKTNRATGALTFEPWNISFMIDSEFKNWQIILKWFMFINNNRDKYIDLQSNYAVDATLRVLDNFRNQKFSLFFVDVWPSSIGEVLLTYREGETNLEAQVSFTYDRYEIREYSVI